MSQICYAFYKILKLNVTNWLVVRINKHILKNDF